VLRFGTDGIRGDAETELTTELVTSLGRAIARALGAPRILIGRDTRESSVRLEAELTVGITSEPCDAVVLGVAPTPAIAYAAASTGQPALVISASHNPWTDNGVKVIGSDGRKLPDATEAAIERELQATSAVSEPTVGRRIVEDRSDAYERHLLGLLDGRTLADMRVALDCANGAAWSIAPQVFRDAGADVEVIHAAPDGRNINAECGSTHPGALQDAVRAHDAQLGLAFDGDADRVLAVDETGALVDGDQLMTMLALDLHARGLLRNAAIAVTVMSNMGLRRALAPAGIDVIETPVGDRNVVIAMQEHDLALGGEQSGHLVFSDHATTGDGLLTGLLVSDLVQRSGRSLAELAAQMRRYPQLLTSVRVARGVTLDSRPEVMEATRAVERELGDRGRVLVRASGTEPVVRIMVEAESQSVAEAAMNRLRSVVEAASRDGQRP
jgi:phosphoglucosamine mutase